MFFQLSDVFSVIAYFVPPILSLILLSVFRRQWVWLALPITAVVDFLVWGPVLTYNYGELQGIALLFLVPQLLIAAGIAFVVLSQSKRKQ